VTPTKYIPEGSVIAVKTVQATLGAKPYTATAESLCPPIEIELPPNYLAPGTIIFIENEAEIWEHQERLRSMSSQELRISPFLDDLENGLFTGFHVSPNGQWLAIEYSYEMIDGNNRYVNELILFPIHANQEHMVIPWDEENWGYIITGWLADSQQLFIIPREDSGYGREDDIIVFNPFTRQQERIIPSFPDPDNIWPEYLMYGRTAYYNPTLNRVVYFLGNYPNTIVLWDIEQSREIWQFTENELMTFAWPNWSPDGNTLTMIHHTPNDNGFEFLFVSQNGVVTHSQVFPNPTRLQTYGWSPDRRYISLRYRYTNWEYRSRLFIYDTYTETLIDQCIENVAREPIWSPDSQQFIVRIEEVTPKGTPEAQRPHRNIVVDLKQNRVFRV